MLKIIISTIFIVVSYSLHLKKKESYMDIYLDNDGLDQLANEIVQKYPQNSYINNCEQDKQIQYLHLGPNQTADAIIVCNIHARQVITAQICLNWAEQYLNSTAPNISINLFYLANRMRDQTIKNNSCIRKNQNGVDLNRNFPTQFNFYKAPKSFQIYSGTSPINESVTKCLQSNIQKNKPLLFLDIHSGENGGLFYQQGYNSRQDRKIFDKLNKQVCNNKCRVTTLARDKEAINGHIFADLKVRKQMKYSLLIQSYGADNFHSCLDQFNPSTMQQKNNTIQFWTRGIDFILNQVRIRQNI